MAFPNNTNYTPRNRPTAGDLMVFRELTPTIVNLAPAWFRRRLMKVIPIKPLREMKAIVDALYNKCAFIYFEKKRIIEENNEVDDDSRGKEKDIMSILREFCALECL